MKSSRGKTPNTVNQNTPAVTPQSSIIPGKFSITDWLDVCEIENIEELVVQIVNEVTQGALNRIFEKTIEERTQLYAVMALKWTILDVIEWRFFESANSPKLLMNDLLWNEDIEPAPCKIDNWAKGAVPCVSPANKVVQSNQDLRSNQVNSNEDINSNQDFHLSQVVHSNKFIEKIDTIHSGDIIIENIKSETPFIKDHSLKEEVSGYNGSNKKLFPIFEGKVSNEEKPYIFQNIEQTPKLPLTKITKDGSPKKFYNRTTNLSAIQEVNQSVNCSLLSSQVVKQSVKCSLPRSINYKSTVNSPPDNKISYESNVDACTTTRSSLPEIINNIRNSTTHVINTNHHNKLEDEYKGFERLNLSALPRYRVRPKYSISDDKDYEIHTKFPSARRVTKFNTTDISMDAHRRLSPPTLVDIIDVAEGVTVREGEFIKKKNPKLINGVTDNERECLLQPIRSTPLPVLVNLSDAVDHCATTRKYTAV